MNRTMIRGVLVRGVWIGLNILLLMVARIELALIILPLMWVGIASTGYVSVRALGVNPLSSMHRLWLIRALNRLIISPWNFACSLESLVVGLRNATHAENIHLDGLPSINGVRNMRHMSIVHLLGVNRQ